MYVWRRRASCALLLLATVVLHSSADEKPAAKPPYERLLKGDDAKEAAALRQRLDERTAADDYAGAVVTAEALLAMRRRVQGNDHHEAVDARWRVELLRKLAGLTAEQRADWRSALHGAAEAKQLARKGQFGAALEREQRLLELRSQLLRDEHPDTAQSCNNLAALSYAQAEYDRAGQFWQRSLAIQRRLLGEDHPDTVTSRNNLAGNLLAQGNYARAETLFREVLAARRRVLGEEDSATAVTWNNLAMSLQFQRKYAQADPCFRHALDAWRRLLGDGHPHTIVGYNNLAYNLHVQGKYTDAEPLFRQALNLCRTLHGEQHPDTARGYSNLALLLLAQGKCAEAELLDRAALDIARQTLGENHPHTAHCVHGLANSLHAQRKWDQAEEHYRRAADIFRRALGEGHPETAKGLHNFALTLFAQEKYAEAEPLFRQALAIRCKACGEDHFDTATTYAGLALNLNAQRVVGEAETLARKALTITRRVLGEDHPGTAQGLFNLGHVLDGQGQYASAESFYRQALDVRRRALGEDHPAMAATLHALAGALHAQEKYAEAAALWARAATSHESARLTGSPAGLDRSTFGHRAPLPQLAACLARLGRHAEAWQRLEQYLARGLLDEAAARALPTRGAEERRRHEDLCERRQRLDAQVDALLRRPGGIDTIREPLRDLGRQRADVQSALQRLEADWSQREVLDLAGIQAHLPEAAALVAWVDAQREALAPDPHGEHWACVVRKTGPAVWVRLPGSGANAAWTKADEDLVGALVPLLARPSTSATGASGEADLLRRLVAQRLTPLQPHLAGVNRLLVVPTGWMARVPVEALSDQWTVCYVPSGSFFARFRERRPNRAVEPSLLALGDPIFSAGQHDRLPGTRREVEAITALFPRADKLLGSDAREERLEELARDDRLRQYRYLHLATHGEVDPRTPRQSALLLSQDRLPDALAQARAGKKVYAGRLTMADILQHWRLDAELVTLSACQTALGREGDGDGFIGFSQALLLAGARSLVVSLWEVDDRATSLLMVRFYQNLLSRRDGLTKPMPKAEALREAKTWLRVLTIDEVDAAVSKLPKLERGGERKRTVAATAPLKPFAHPYYWSAFILIGDPE